MTTVAAMTDLLPAEPYAHGARVELDAVPLAVVRHEGVRLDDLRELFDTTYPAIGALFGTGTLVPAGPALAVYHGDVQQAFDIEIGFPVIDPLTSPVRAGELEVVGVTLPAGPAVAATHLGPYDGLGEAWGRLVDTPGVSPRGTWIEVYVTEPGPDPSTLRTDLLMPVTDQP